MHNRRATGHNVENLEVAADVIAIGDEILFRRRRDAHVAERGPLHNGVVVRAHEQADVYRIRERHAGEFLRDERVTESRDRHDIDAVAPLELEHRVRALQAVARLSLLRHPAGRSTKLERHESIAMQRRGYVRAVGLERRANGPADLPVFLDSRADEARPRGENEVARHPLPYEMKIVAVVPH